MPLDEHSPQLDDNVPTAFARSQLHGVAKSSSAVQRAPATSFAQLHDRYAKTLRV